MKVITFNRDTDAMGFALFVAMMQNHSVRYCITEAKDIWIITLQ